MKILIADDHAIVRKGLKQIIESSIIHSVVEEAESGEEALNKSLNSDYDVIVLDISMPGRSGLEILNEIKTHKPDSPILILSIHPENQYAVRVMKAGASGYITKDTAPEELVNAINKVNEGRKYISQSLAEKLIIALRDNNNFPHENLSDRELSVMCKLANGKSITEIANELNLSIKTVSTYKTRLFVKMNFSSIAELTRYCMDKELL